MAVQTVIRHRFYDNDGTLLALLQVDKWRMLVPVKHGDTILMQSTVRAKKETSKPDRGVVTFYRECLNQDGVRVQEALASITGVSGSSAASALRRLFSARSPDQWNRLTSARTRPRAG